MEQKQGFILYIDLLGYKNIVLHNTEKENEELLKILDSIAKSESNHFHLIFGVNYDKKKTFMRAFSDNFLLLFETERNDAQSLRNMMCLATRIQRELLGCGYLSRGSITYGTISYTDSIVFGADLINAVALEEGHKEPSVIVDDKLIKDLSTDAHPIKRTCNILDCWPDDPLSYDACINGLKKYIERLNGTVADQTVLNKVAWIIGKINEHFAKKQGHKIALFEVVKYEIELVPLRKE